MVGGEDTAYGSGNKRPAKASIYRRRFISLPFYLIDPDVKEPEEGGQCANRIPHQPYTSSKLKGNFRMRLPVRS